MLPKEGHDVIISGVGGKFPGTNNITDLQEKLFAKEDLVTEHNNRWTPGCFNTPKATGKILEENKYDANFFGVYRKLCMRAEPMMKLTMERCYEAFIDAGINPFTLKGHNIAVVVCTLNSESEILYLTHDGLVDGFAIQGHSQALIANRLSYFFNFTGPSVTVNFSNTGGMFAMEHAATLIRQGAVSAAIVATSYLMWYPSVSTEFADLNLLTFDNKSCPFDDNAKGMIRSDGVVAYFLQRKEDANRIYANIIDIDSKCLGSRDCSFLKFDTKLQKYLSNFYKNCSCDTQNIGYLEPEGMAVKDLDAVELNSLASVLSPGRKSPLLIGSVKSNLGHAHVSASFMALAKAIIAMETGRIPPTLNYQTPNSNIPALINGSLKVVTEEAPLEGDLVALNNITFSGTVGHMLLRRHDKPKSQQSTADAEGLPADGLPRLVVFSARHEEGAIGISQKIQSMPLDTEFISLVNNIHKVGIPNHLYRSYTIVPKNSTSSNVDVLFCDSDKQRPIWFVFSGMGSQWKRMGQDLLKLPVFAETMKKCDEVLKPKGVDIEQILTSDDDSVFENLLNSFVGITAVQIGLVDILSAVGVQPDGIIGHSAGEVASAYADGCLTLQETMLAAWARGKASVDDKLINGLMAAVGMGFKDVQSYLLPTVDVACHNSPNSCTISGPEEDVLQVISNLKERQIFVKAVNTGGRSFHSRYIIPVADKLRKALKEIIPKPKARSSRWVCTSMAVEDWETEDAKFASAAYYVNNMMNPVLFEEGCAFIPADAVAIEIAPYGLMQAVLRWTLSENVINIPLTSKTAESNLMHLLSALGKIHNSKVDVDVNALYPPVEYPVSRGTPSLAPLITWDHTDTWFVEFTKVLAMITEEKSEMSVVIDDSCNDYKLWSDHCVDNETVIPLAQLLAYPWKVILDTKKLNYQQQAVEIQEVVVSHQVLVHTRKQDIEVSVFRGSEQFEVSLCTGENILEPCVTGKISAIKQVDLDELMPQTSDHPRTRVTKAEFYSVLAQHSYRLGPQFQVLRSLFLIERDFQAVLAWTGDMRIFLDALFKLLVFVNCKTQNQLVKVSSIRKLVIDTPHFSALPKGAEVDVFYNSKTNTLLCEGLQLEGVTLSSQDLKQIKSTSLVWKSVKFVPYTENIPKLEAFLNTSVQLVAEAGLNCWSNKAASFVTLELRDDANKPFIAHTPLQDLLKSLPNVSTRIQVNTVQKVKQDLLQQAQQKTCLVIGEYKSLRLLIDFAPDQRNVFYLTFLPNGEQLEDNKLQQVLSHQLSEGALVLLKMWSDPGKLRVFQLDWMAGLRQFMSHNRSGQPVVVVSRHWQPRQALKTLALETYAHQLRCVFLDKQAPQFSLTSPLFARQLALGLSVNMLSGRTWGSYRTADLPNVLPNSENLCKLESSVKSLKLNCIALNTRNFTLDAEVPSDQVKLKYLDFCGTKRNGERVMGIGCYDQKSEKVVTDPVLVWSVPTQWSLENAVTVPFCYSLAYYSLLLRAKLKKGESVLVHAGMSPIGQAAIAVSLEVEANVYVTVSTEDQLTKLLTLFPQINTNNVIVMEINNVELEMKRLTKNQGVDVIISCLKDMNAMFRSVSQFSRMVHLGDVSVENKDRLGMFPFLKNSSFFGVSLDNLLNSAAEEKLKLKTLVENGIKDGVVKPLKSSQFSVDKAADALKNFQLTNSQEKTVLLKPENFNSMSFKCDPNESYIIIGTKQGLWLSLAEWLLRNGARKLVIASLKQNMTTNVSRKFNNFMSQHSATIMMTTITRLDTNKATEEFIREAVKMGPVGGIFFTFMEEKSHHVRHLDVTSRLVIPQLKQFVCLLGGSAGVCQSRAELGLSSCLIQSESPLHKPHTILPYLSTVLAQTSTTHTFLISDYSSISKHTGMTPSLQDIKDYLPVSLKELERLGQSFLSSVQGELQERITLSPGYQFVKFQLLPVFLVPGIDSRRLDPLIKQLIHPAFCPRLTPCMATVSESAELLVQKLLRIQSKGPYNIVGETWSGAVALQMATMLDCQGHQVNLFLLDAAPQTSHLWAKTFCHYLEEFSNTKFLMALLNLPANISRSLSDLKSWEEQLQFSLQCVQLPSENQSEAELSLVYERIGTALTAMRNHLKGILEFQQPQQLFGGNIHLFRTREAADSDYCGLKKFCKNTPTLHIMEDDTLEEMIENPKTAAAINEDLAFTWDL